MEVVIAELHYKPDDLWDYYQQFGMRFLTWSRTRDFSIFSLTSVFITVCLYFLSLSYDEISWLFFLSAIISVVLIICLIIYTALFIRWKRRVKTYVNSYKKYKVFKYTIRENSFELMLDGNVTLEKWTNTKSAKITESSIIITGNSGEEYLLLAKPIEPQLFEKVKELVKKKFADAG